MLTGFNGVETSAAAISGTTPVKVQFHGRGRSGKFFDFFRASISMTENNSPPEKLSAAEAIKANSHFLRGTIVEELAQPSDKFNKDNSALLKFHGTYQQDDRETAREAAKGARACGSTSSWSAPRFPGGKLTADQLLAELDLCDEVGNSTLRITSRQGLQLHGVLKANLQETIRRINEIQLSTLAACGDVKRNVMCCPAPHHNDPVHAEMQQLADQLAELLAPRTRAYHEIWLRDPETGEEQYLGRQWIERARG